MWCVTAYHLYGNNRGIQFTQNDARIQGMAIAYANKLRDPDHVLLSYDHSDLYDGTEVPYQPVL